MDTNLRSTRRPSGAPRDTRGAARLVLLLALLASGTVALAAQDGQGATPPPPTRGDTAQDKPAGAEPAQEKPAQGDTARPGTEGTRPGAQGEESGKSAPDQHAAPQGESGKDAAGGETGKTEPGQEAGGDTGHQDEGKEPVKLTNPFESSHQADVAGQIKELFQKVERKLVSVDRQLEQAGAGVMPLQAPKDSGIDDLLNAATRQSRELESDIDQILDLAQQLGGMQGSPQSGQPQPNGQGGGDSPLDKNRSNEPQGREKTPEGPQDHPQDQDQGKEKPQDQKQDGQPKGNEEDRKPGENRPGQDPQDKKGDAQKNDRDADRWGDLPVRVREVFRNQGRDDLPVQYRDWIDAYYRRLNQDGR